MLRLSRLTATIFLLIASAVAATAQTPSTTKVTFILVNDIYLMSEQALSDGHKRGGFARLAAVVKAERAKGGHVIFAHGGDTLSPSIMSGLDRGAHIVSLTNIIPPDIFVPGNHEFDFGKAVFLQRMREAKFPVYAANLRGPDGQPLGFKDRAIITFDDVRIGLTGIAYDQTPRSSSPEDLTFLPTLNTAKEQAQALRREGADFVVAVMHADRRQSLDLYGSQTADLIMTGHTHDLFLSYDGRAALVESSYDAHYVVAVDVTIQVAMHDGKRQTSWWPQFRVIDTANVSPDPEVGTAVAKFEAELSREMDVPVATTDVTFDSRNATVRTREAMIGNLMADAMRTSTGADVAIMNGGGIRAGKTYQAGSAITRRDVLAELPFGNRVALIELSGKDLRAALENGYSQLPQGSGRFPQLSGMSVVLDLGRPPGSRIVTVNVGNAPLDEGKIYTLATNDFLARGSDGYTMFRDAKRLLPDYDSRLVANEVMVYLRKLGTVKAAGEPRITVK